MEGGVGMSPTPPFYCSFFPFYGYNSDKNLFRLL